MKHALARRRLSGRALMWLCVAGLLLSLMPLYALSAYNHACRCTVVRPLDCDPRPIARLTSGI